ncbi:MAG: hypothetical protein KJ676_09125 [Alphaproteobacteria bacterium]|nr:hypothetical protein [Alphaproteobacteria bacterium]MBU1525510.1 hypothetical protein [Alphaproteobacteria bacterium]MBU2117933.1 hypothetical protein [Alphaproteobacteria bacterium]MBU2350912.1 hypothetical protein [Alphaproteobacteria bacterium]MBU2383079.1 hypothetical protein [Alphaproteobacteria bacterium]
MSVALALSAVLATTAPDPLSAADLPAVLGKGWWCTWDAAENGCFAIQRYDFARGETYRCTGSDVAWLDIALSWADGGLRGAMEARPLIRSLKARADAHGARLIKVCWTSTFKLDGDDLCEPDWATVGGPTMRLSRNGAWQSEDDLVVPPAEAAEYFTFWPAAFDEMVANLPAEAIGDAEVKSFVAIHTAGVTCQSYTRADGGVLRRESDTGARASVHDLRPLSRPEDGVLVQRLD